jgi:hypothetical protein
MERVSDSRLVKFDVIRRSAEEMRVVMFVTVIGSSTTMRRS